MSYVKSFSFKQKTDYFGLAVFAFIDYGII